MFYIGIISQEVPNTSHLPFTWFEKRISLCVIEKTTTKQIRNRRMRNWPFLTFYLACSRTSNHRYHYTIRPFCNFFKLQCVHRSNYTQNTSKTHSVVGSTFGVNSGTEIHNLSDFEENRRCSFGFLCSAPLGQRSAS